VLVDATYGCTTCGLRLVITCAPAQAGRLSCHGQPLLRVSPVSCSAPAGGHRAEGDARGPVPGTLYGGEPSGLAARCTRTGQAWPALDGRPLLAIPGHGGTARAANKGAVNGEASAQRQVGKSRILTPMESARRVRSP
jgi:hypothetical protein